MGWRLINWREIGSVVYEAAPWTKGRLLPQLGLSYRTTLKIVSELGLSYGTMRKIVPELSYGNIRKIVPELGLSYRSIYIHCA